MTNLPIFDPLRTDMSTYITFSTANKDFDREWQAGGKCFFTRMVAVNIPDWKNGEFYADLSALGVAATDANTVFPKMLQMYTENIMRQDIECPNIAEVSFWKTMERLGLSPEQRRAMFTVTNKIAVSNFTDVNNTAGWAEIVTQIPNKCKLMYPAWKNAANIPATVQCNGSDLALYDNELKQFIFSTEQTEIIDFDNIVLDDVSEQEIEFNAILLYYQDSEGIDKLHGINFIYHFTDNITEQFIERLTQKTNKVATLGYQFIFDIKSCNTPNTKTVIYDEHENTHWMNYMETLSRLNTFLELKTRE